MGTQERTIVCMAIRVIKKVGLLDMLKKAAEKTENGADDMVVSLLISAIEMADTVICQAEETNL